MGFFSKKVYTCAICGKEVSSRLPLGDFVCDECMKKYRVQGYIDYRNDLSSFTAPIPEIPFEDYEKIAAKRDRILEKYCRADKITREELEYARDNYKKMSRDQITDFIERMLDSIIIIYGLGCGLGHGSTGCFYVLSKYDDVVVDTEDIFAVGFTSDLKLEFSKTGEVILCAVFTNDPHVPVFPVVYFGKRGLFEAFKSKKGREAVKFIFNTMCPNLKYPVDDLKQLKKIIKESDHIEGNLDKEFMLDKISDARTGSGIFKTDKMVIDLTPETMKTLEGYGFYTEDEIKMQLGLDRVFGGSFWRKEIERVSEEMGKRDI